MAGFPEYMRVFTAVDLDGSLRSRVHRSAGELLRGLGRASAPPRENLHVTLKFIGEVRRDELAALNEAVLEGAERLVPGLLRVSGFGAFPSPARPRVVWAGVSDPAGILTPVHEHLNRTLTAFGARQEKKRFVPHVTVGRIRGPFDAEEFSDRLEDAGDADFGTQHVESITLYMSEMEKGSPPRYTALGHYRAGGTGA